MHDFRHLLLLPLISLATAGPAAAETDACVPPAGRYDFAIDVSGLGQVGALTGIVKTTAEGATIDVQTQIVVRIAGIAVHRHVETRHTEWRAGRLFAYRADIRSNGKRSTVRVARGASGLTATRNGAATTLPADAVPGFPWARCIVDRKHIFGLSSTRPSPIVVAANMALSLRVAGRDVPAREVRFTSPKGWVAWFAEDGTLLRHSFDSGGRRVTLIRTLPKR